MPIYVYENGAGDRVEELRLYKDRDKCPNGFTRVSDPPRFSSPGQARNPSDMKTGIMAGYYKEECVAGSRWKSDYSKKQIKKAWSE